MTVNKLKNLEKIVKPILEDIPITRNDDFLLYAEVIEKSNVRLLALPTRAFLLGHKEFNVPSYESVTRVRRKIQAEHPELESERTKIRRAKEQANYIQYATDKT